MKVRVILSIVVMSIFFTGCEGVSINLPSIDVEIFDFTHSGHDYIVFTERGRTINIIHNPDCSCHLHDVK